MFRTSIFIIFCFFFSMTPLCAQEEQVPNVPETSQEITPTTPSDPLLPTGEAMRFSFVHNGNCNNCISIVAEGSIVAETPNVFEDFMSKNVNPPTSLILLHSRGGDLLAAMALGKLFREKGFNTNVAQMVRRGEDDNNQYMIQPGYCADACVWAYLGGNERRLENGSVIILKTLRPPLNEAGTVSGMEIPSRKQQLADIAYIDDYAASMGFNRTINFVDWQNTEAHRFTPEEISSLGITFSPDALMPWILKLQKGGLVAQARTQNSKKIVRFYCDNRSQSFFEITVPFGVDSKVLNNLSNEPTYISVLGKKIRLNRQQFTLLKNGTTTLKIKLTNFNPVTLSEPLYSIMIENAPEQLKPFDLKDLNHFSSFKEMSQIALHACINDR